MKKYFINIMKKYFINIIKKFFIIAVFKKVGSALCRSIIINTEKTVIFANQINKTLYITY